MIYDTLEEAAKAASAILDKNWDGHSTVPGRGLYPHQWSWDAGLIALGYSRYDNKRAQQELRALFDGQWENGMLPHIVFSDKAGDYFPGFGYWKSDLSPAYPDTGVKTSGCIQPPVHVTAVRAILHNASDQKDALEFVEELYPKLCRWIDYLYRERDPHDEGLVYIRHPWESGRDNSPVWDTLLHHMQFDCRDIPDFQRDDTGNWKADGRPSDRQYDCYIYLCEIFKKARYIEAEMQKTCPFLVQDLLFNTILCQAGQDLAELADAVGEDSKPHLDRADRTRDAMRNKLWRKEYGVFLPWDMVADRPLARHEIGGFSPLYGGIPTKEQAQAMCDHLDERYLCPGNDKDAADCYGVASYSRYDIDYDPGNYWRGPVWININWMIAQGLERYGFNVHRDGVMRAIRNLPLKSGFREYFNPETGAPRGSVNFSWSASLFLDCYHGGYFKGIG